VPENCIVLVFGTALADVVVREERSSGVPIIIERIGEYISTPPVVLEEGLFRVSGKTSERDALIELLDKGINLTERRERVSE
jgi:hypothetical protein